MQMAFRGVVALGLMTATLGYFAGCGNSDSTATPAGGAGSGGGASTGLPFCYRPSADCKVVDGTKCMATVDNSAATRKTLRLSQLQVLQPKGLASKPIQFTVVGPAVTLNEPKCGLKTDKGGQFNWLLDFDLTAKKLRTGGARIANPDDGYCFLKTNVGGVPVEPILADISYDEATGKFGTTSKIDKLVVPIFTTTDANNVPILLPITNAEIADGTLTEKGNCIGRFKGEDGELDENCQTKTSDVGSPDAYQFENAGKVRGVITLEETEQVRIVDLNQTLCHFLFGISDPNDSSKCPRGPDGKLTAEVMAKADSASVPGGPNDSVALEAAFSAASIKIKDTGCN
jgi:hypothetical protein